MSSGWFVTGTDTAVGKTLFSTALIHALAHHGHAVAGFKPVASGCDEHPEGLRNDDAMRLMQASNVSLSYDEVNPHAFAPAIAPHLAAAQAHTIMDLAAITANLHQRNELLVVEGIGGWEVPLNDTQNVSDLARQLGLPVILVVGLRLGCLNHALLSANAIRAKGVSFAGWVANELDPHMFALEENIETLKSRMAAPLLCRIPFSPEPDAQQIAGTINLASLLA